MNETELVIFDLDGTLFNTKRGIVKAIKKAIETENLEPLSEDIYDTFIGPPIQQTFAKVYGVSAERGNELAVVFRKYYGQDDYILMTDEYDGMRQALKDLKSRGIKTALATFKKEKMAWKICRHFGYDGYLDSIHGSDEEGKRQKPDIIELCMKDCGCSDPKKAVMVGDSIFDAKGAMKAGTRFAGVTWGFGFSTEDEILSFEGARVLKSTKEIATL